MSDSSNEITLTGELFTIVKKFTGISLLLLSPALAIWVYENIGVLATVILVPCGIYVIWTIKSREIIKEVTVDGVTVIKYRWQKMVVQYSCPNCDEELHSPAIEIGVTENCPICDEIYDVPGSSAIDQLNKEIRIENSTVSKEIKTKKQEEYNGGQAQVIERATSNSLVSCPDCGKSVSKTADICPNCGRDLGLWWGYGLLILLVIMGAVSIVVYKVEKKRNDDIKKEQRIWDNLDAELRRNKVR